MCYTNILYNGRWLAFNQRVSAFNPIRIERGREGPRDGEKNKATFFLHSVLKQTVPSSGLCRQNQLLQVKPTIAGPGRDETTCSNRNSYQGAQNSQQFRILVPQMGDITMQKTSNLPLRALPLRGKPQKKFLAVFCGFHNMNTFKSNYIYLKLYNNKNCTMSIKNTKSRYKFESERNQINTDNIQLTPVHLNFYVLI